MKKIVFTLLLALVTTFSHAQTHLGNLTLSSQTEIDDFNFTEVTGDLTINDTDDGNITNLRGLRELTQIGGNLSIESNDSLTSLSGLEMLDFIGGRLIISENPALIDFCAISSLVGDANQITAREYTVNDNGYNPIYNFIQKDNLCSNADGRIVDGDLRLLNQASIDRFNSRGVTGDLTISSNTLLSSLSGLESLTDIGGNLSIIRNSSLMSLSGLDSLTDIGGILLITSNRSLSSLNGLDSLNQIGENLTIQNNDSLTSLSGLESLTDIGGNLSITSNRSLMSLSGLESLTNIGRFLRIQLNTSLSSLSGLESLTDIGGYLDINNNASLSSLSGLESLTDIDGYLNIQNNDSLQSLSGLDSLTEIGGYLDIQLNTSLSSLSGLESLTDIDGYLNIQNNDSLQSLSGLESLTEIGGYLRVQSNPSLRSLSGLEMLHSIGDTLDIIGNAGLSNFCAISSLVGDANQITLGEYSVTTNGYNPLYTEIQTTTRCSLDPPVVVANLQDVSIQTGDSFDSINVASSFSDPNRYPLTYTATSSDETAITVSISNSTLTLTEVGVDTATITVTATNDSILSVSNTFTVFITPNLPPTVANQLIDIETVSGTAFEAIDISAVFSDRRQVLTYTVATSDSTIVTAALNGDTLTLTETGKGTATITVTAADPFGLSVDASFEATITNTTPEVLPNQLVNAFTQPGIPFAPIDLSAAFTDANGDELTYTATSSDEAVVTVSVSGTTLTLTEVAVDTATITVTATDGEASISATFRVFITPNMPPKVENTLTDVEIVSGTAFAPIDISAVFSDPEGEVLIYRVATSNESIVTAVLNGTTLTLTETGKGTAIVTVRAIDAFGLPFDASFEATITNSAPEVVPNQLVTVFTELGTAAFAPINLSAAFTDANGDELTYTVTSSDSTVVTVSVDGDTLTLTEVGVGTATITVTATDGDSSISTAFTVSITQNLPPTVENTLIDVENVSGTAFAPIDISAVFSDPDGDDDALTYTVATSDSTIVTAALNGDTLTLTEVGVDTATITVTATDGGASVSATFSVFITPNMPPTVENTLIDVEIVSGTAFAPIDISAVFSDPDGDDDSLTYTVATSDSSIVTAVLNGTTLTLTETGKGTATITVTATDIFGLPFDATFEVTIMNTAPVVANRLVNAITQPGTPFAPIDISAVFSDPDGDELTYKATSSDSTVVTVSVSGTTLTLTEVAVDTATITVIATDGEASVSATFRVFITPNMPPTVENTLTDVEIVSGTAFETIDISAVFSDPDGDDDALTYTVATSDTSIVTVALNGTTLTLTETGKGTAIVTVTAADTFGLPFDASFEATITNSTPEVLPNQLVTVFTELGTAAFAPINLSAAFTDANGDELTYTVTSSDSTVVTVSVDGDTLTLTEVGVGTATITVIATDGDASVSTEFTVSITQNLPPTVANTLIDIETVSGTAFAPIDLSAVFSDPDGDDDSLTYTVATSDTSIVTAALNGDTLTLTEVGVDTATITVTATDEDGASVDETFMVTISSSTNISPMRTTATFISALTINIDYVGSPTSLIPFFMDSDGDVLEFSVESSDITIVTAEIVNGSSFNFTPVSIGSATITITATDPGGLSASERFILTIKATEETLGIADTDILAVYPNPSSSLFQLSRRVAMVRVYDMSGRLVYRGSNTKQLDLTNQPSGQYLVEVEVGKERGRYSVIKQ